MWNVEGYMLTTCDCNLFPEVTVNQDQNHSSLSVLLSTQDHRQGVLDAPMMLVMQGDYQSSQSANVRRGWGIYLKMSIS